jgi:hypothetical protein
MTQPIWEGWMQAAHRDLKPEERVKPAGVQTLPAFIVRSHVGIGSVEPSPANDLFPSWYKKRSATGTKRTIDIVSNKLATDCTPNRAKKEVTDAAADQFSFDKFVNPGQTSNTSERDDVHKCDDIKPTVRAVLSGDTINADITQGTHPLSSERFPGTVNFIIDGQIVRSFSISAPGVVSYKPDSNFDGSKEVKVEVIDSVLYDASDTVTVTGSGGGGGDDGISLTVTNQGGGTYKFTWNNIDGATSYEICVDSNAMPETCSPGSSGDTRIVAGGNREAYIKANNGEESDVESF